jgi:endonuclease YncB( thermonuclease family)
MLQFKPRQPEISEPPERWRIGVDKRHVSVYIALALLAGIALGVGLDRFLTRKQAPEPSFASEQRTSPRAAASDRDSEFHNVSKVLRADTIEVETVGPVRMLGIETPDGKSPVEIYGVHGQRAFSYVEKTLLGQAVRLEYDSTASGSKDDLGQALAYVYTRDGVLINAEMVKQGLAFVRGTEQFRLASDFRGFERVAMQSMRGVWGPTFPTVASEPVIPTLPLQEEKTKPGEKPKPEDKAKKLTPLPPSAVGANIPAISGLQSSSLEPGVWISPSDKMYHRSSCSFLDKKKHSVSLSQAKSEGYTACSRCYASTLLKAP